MSGPGRKPTISDAKFLQEMRLIPEPVVTATEIADRIDMTPQGVNQRLDDLVDAGYVKQKKVGARAVVYWLTDAGLEKAAQGD
jgi:predicted transcriptional regulator